MCVCVCVCPFSTWKKNPFSILSLYPDVGLISIKHVIPYTIFCLHFPNKKKKKLIKRNKNKK